jgi:hypothetical protein
LHLSHFVRALACTISLVKIKNLSVPISAWSA